LYVNFTWAIDNFSFSLAHDGGNAYSPPFSIDQQNWRVLLWRDDKSVVHKTTWGSQIEVTELLSIRLVPYPQTEKNVSIQASWEILWAKSDGNGIMLNFSHRR
jgi:hypothetical protein